MWKIFSFFTLIITSASSQLHCTGNCDCSNAALNGILEMDCWGFKECNGGVLTMHVCPDTQEFDRDLMLCVDKGITDCSKDFVCQGKADGMHADLGDKCESFVTCINGVYEGHSWCPATLVFNETLQVCDYIDDVYPPCGTKN